MPKCSAPNCKNASYNKTPDISFHQFPKNEKLKNIWLKNINRKGWQPHSRSLLCSKHFTGNSICYRNQRRVLVPGAIPTLFEDSESPEENKENVSGLLDPLVTGRKRTATGDIVLRDVQILVASQFDEPGPSTSGIQSHSHHIDTIKEKRAAFGKQEQSVANKIKYATEGLAMPEIFVPAKSITQQEKGAAFGQQEQSVANKIKYATEGLAMPEIFVPAESVTQQEKGAAFGQQEQSVANKIKYATEGLAMPEIFVPAESVRQQEKGAAFGQQEQSVANKIKYATGGLAMPENFVPAESVTQQDQENVPGVADVSEPQKIIVSQRVQNTHTCAEVKQLKNRIVFKNKQLKALREKHKRLKKKVATFSDIIMELKNKLNNEDVEILKNIPGNNKDFLIRCIKKSMHQPVQKTFSPDLRSFALQLNFYSARAYNFVRDTFNTILPHPVTISRWYKKVDAKPGFTSETFNILDALQKKSVHKLFVNLSVDEMAIRKELVWNGKKFEGRIDTATEVNDDSLPLATQALVLMVTGINAGWSLPIAFFFICSMNGEQRANIVKMAINMLYEIKIFVKGLTFDGAAANISMATQLGCSFDINKLIPFFILNDQKIHVFWDPCHMVKLIRNTLGDFKIFIDQDGNEINFKYMESLLKLNESKGLHLANKIKEAHINFAKQKMKVRLATQLLSKSVSDALIYCKEKLKLSEFEGCLATAKFLNIINDCFDILNSRSMYAPGYKKALCPANIARTVDYINMCKEYIKKIKLSNNQLIVNSGRKTGFLGFIICLQSAVNMFDDLIIQEKLRFLCTYKISQDHLEMFFGKMRSRGGYNDNPNTVQFQTAYKKNLIRLEISLNKNSNFTENISILTVTSTERNDIQSVNDTTPSFEKNVISEVGDEEDDLDFYDFVSLDEYTEDVTVYIAGFVARKFIKKVRCTNCHSLVLSDKENFIQSLIKTKDRGGLTYPSEGVIAVVQHCEKIFKYSKTYSLTELSNQLWESKNYYNYFNSEDKEHDANHVYLLVKIIIKFYMDTRLKHYAKMITSNVTKRNHLKKMVLFSNK